MAGRFPATFIGVASGSVGRLAVYATSDGHRLRFLTAPEPGGGLGGLALSANGRTVAFQRALGTCAAAIDTVRTSGGKERTLIPMTGSGSRTALPVSPSYSGDGRYLMYETSRCLAPFNPLVHLRNLHTGRELSRSASRFAIPPGAVFVHDDKQVAYITFASRLAVRQVPSFAVKTHAPPPRTCRYQALAGTERKLVALLQCGPQHVLSLVTLSTRTFGSTGSLARIGHCLKGIGLSLAVHDPSAILAETKDARSPPRSSRARIFTVRGAAVTQVRSGLFASMPHEVLW